MKSSILSILKGAALGLVVLTMASCQSTGNTAADGPAVMCDKCKTVWVKRPQQTGISNKGGMISYRDEKVMQCPDCENAVVTFFKTGSLKHHCSHCGGTMNHCTTH